MVLVKVRREIFLSNGCMTWTFLCMRIGYFWEISTSSGLWIIEINQVLI
jgi:hypothetical protein